ncbi:MAG: APC family permease [Candidatus Babeliales bacterium]
MTQHHTLSLPTAILININIMLGVGIFINTAELATRAGALGCLSYALVGILLLPLIICVAELVKLHPSGGFYIFARREINPFFGFLSAWIYFTGKLASAAIMIHTSVLILQQLITSLTPYNPLLIDGCILSFFIALNMLNMKAGSRIQALFTTLKASVIIFAILVGFFLFNLTNFDSAHCVWTGIPSSLPLVLYAAMGFEAACSLSSRIQNAQRNAPLAIFISYAIVISIITLYQCAVYGVLGDELTHLGSYRDAFPALVEHLAPNNTSLAHTLGMLFNLAIASSALGGSYGILFSNTWNLYAIAQHKHIIFPSLFTTLNKHMIPYACIIAEGLLCGLYLFVTQGSQVPLQQTSALAAVLTYTISVCALLRANRKSADKKYPFASLDWLRTNGLPLLGLISCDLLITACITGLINTGIGSLTMFSVLLIIGIVMFLCTPGRYLDEVTEV